MPSRSLNMREQFVARNLELINHWKGKIPVDVRAIVAVLRTSTGNDLTTEQFNALQDFADHVDAQTRLSRFHKERKTRKDKAPFVLANI